MIFDEAERKKVMTDMESIKLVRYIGSFIRALIIVAIPFICALSYALDWSIYKDYTYSNYYFINPYKIGGNICGK